MKAALSLFALSLALANPAHAVSGKIIAQCQGTDDKGAEVSVRLQITPMHGLTLFVVRGETLEVMEAAVENTQGPRGFTYEAKSASLSVANVQAPNRAAGTYAAFLTVGQQPSVIVDCK